VIGINWFEAFLPDKLGMPITRFAATDQLPPRGGFPYRTVVRRDGDGCRLFHLTAESLPKLNLAVETIRTAAEPNVVKHVLEQGFASKLEAQGFRVRLAHVGGSSFRDTSKSLYPTVYQTVEGLRFRCFFFDSGSEATPRFGLVLSVTTGVRFIVSLDDPVLRRLAFGTRVVPKDLVEDNEVHHDGRHESLIFQGVDESLAILVDATGAPRRESLTKWTLPGRRDLLRSYILKTQGDQAANRTIVSIQQDDLTLTPERRMNVRLAFDQLKRLQGLLRSAELLTFSLPVPGAPLARLTENPMTIGPSE
jgi:hypothetical protein